MADGEPGSGAAAGAFTIARVFDAPRDVVWKAWTEAGHLKRWWGPKGLAVRHCAIGLRPGGLCHYGLQAPDGSMMWGRWVFREIAAPERLVFVASFSDERGGVTPYPWAGNWPLETLSTVTFSEEGGRTTVTVRWTAETGSAEDRAAFAAGFGSMRQGWTGTLDKLDAHLAQA